jgi:hypothetical protein
MSKLNGQMAHTPSIDEQPLDFIHNVPWVPNTKLLRDVCKDILYGQRGVCKWQCKGFNVLGREEITVINHIEININMQLLR